MTHNYFISEKNFDASRTKNIILVHGGGGAKQDMTPLAKLLSEKLHVESFNLLGHGGRIEKKSYTLADMADDLASHIIKAGLNKPIVFGYCLGGSVTMNMICRYSSLFGGAILLAAPCSFDDTRISHFEYLSSREFIMRDPGRVKEWQEKHGPNWLSALDNIRGMYQHMRSTTPIDPDCFENIDCSVMVIAPTNDPVVPLQESRDLVARIPNSKLCHLTGTAHPQEVLPYANISNIIFDFMGY